MEVEFWIKDGGDTAPVLYTKNHLINVVKRIMNQNPVEAVEPQIVKTFVEESLIHEARNHLLENVTIYKGAIKDNGKDKGKTLPATRHCVKKAIKDIIMMLSDNTEKLIIMPVVMWEDLDIVYNLCKGYSVHVAEETRIRGPLSFKMQEMEKNVAALMTSMETFTDEAQRRWSLEEARWRGDVGVAGHHPSSSQAVNGSARLREQEAGGGRGGKGGGRQAIPGLHHQGAPEGAQQMASSLQVPEGGEESWRDVAGQRRKTSSGGLQGRRGRDLQEGHVEKVKARTRPQAKFGTRVINIEGAEAAPVSFFIGNTSPKSNKEAIAKVIIQCANEMEGNFPGRQFLAPGLEPQTMGQQKLNK